MVLDDRNRAIARDVGKGYRAGGGGGNPWRSEAAPLGPIHHP